MSVTYQELLEHLESLDEITLMELLELNSELIVAAFGDRIEDMSDQLFMEFEDDEQD